MLTSLEEIYTTYDETLTKVRKNTRMFDGFLGLGKDPRKDPCHQVFYDAVGAWVADFTAAEHTQEETLAVALFLVEKPVPYREKECYWFMFAAQGHMKPIIPLLSKESCKTVHDRLEACYKKYDRMPLQKELLKILARNAK